MNSLSDKELDEMLNSSQSDFWTDHENVDNVDVEVGEVIDITNIDEIVPISNIILISEKNIGQNQEIKQCEMLTLNENELTPVPESEREPQPEDESENDQLDLDNNFIMESEEQLHEAENQIMDTDTQNTLEDQNGAVASDSLRKTQMLRRMHGKDYKGMKKQQENNKWKYTVNRNERKMKPFCDSAFCKKIKTRYCHSFNEEVRKSIFTQFRKMSWDMKKVYVSSLIDIKTPKEKKSDNEISRRGFTYDYFLFKKNSRFKVCKITFLNTLGINQWMAIHFASSSNNNRTCLPKHVIKTPTRSRQTDAGAVSKQCMTKWLRDLPKLESHYCRSSTSKLYLEPVFFSKMDVYRQYKLSCVAANKKVLSTAFFF